MGRGRRRIQPRRTSYLRRREARNDSPWANRAANAGRDKPDSPPTLSFLLIMFPPSARQLTINSFLKSAGTPELEQGSMNLQQRNGYNGVVPNDDWTLF